MTHADNMRFSIIGNVDGWCITDGSEIRGVTDQNDIEALESYLRRHFSAVEHCPHCSLKPVVANGAIDQDDGQRFMSSVMAWACPNCGYWQFYEDSFLDRPSHGRFLAWDWQAAASKLGTFFESLPEGCELDLVRHLRKNPRPSVRGASNGASHGVWTLQ
ncbi:MAG: hypothetical protein M3305_12265 [Actinomycetota bacterium]|nr:hypothetical protein [Actinomycetota bacterium]